MYQKTIESLTADIKAERTADIVALTKADSIWAAASLNEGAKGPLSYYVSGVIQLPPTHKITGDGHSITKVIQGLYSLKGTHNYQAQQKSRSCLLWRTGICNT